MAALRERREAQYETLKAAVYKRRGWTPEGIPSVAAVRRLGIDFPEVLALLAEKGVQSLVTVGDRSLAWQAGMTVASLLALVDDEHSFAVVKLDGKLVSRPHFATTPVRDGARIDPIPMIAGG